MSFYDIDPMTLPADAVYYHNVLMVCIGVAPSNWKLDVEDTWYLDKLQDARPTACIFYIDEDLEEETDEDGEPIKFEITFINHCVVEVCSDNSVCWYSTQSDESDFDLRDAWRIK